MSAFVVFFGILNAFQLIQEQGSTLLETLPSLWPQVLDKVNQLQVSLENKVGIKLGLGATQWLVQFGSETQDWLLTHLPKVLADTASAAFLVPIFSFFLLKDGTQIKEQFYHFLPEHFRTSTSEVIQETSRALAAYLRAKIIEASSVGLLAWIGFWLIGAPYAGVLALMVGLTNIIPYLGIALGALPPLLIFSLTESFQPLFWPALIVLIVVNAIDTLLIFPVFVAKIVNLSPLTLLAAVAVGQEYYGLIGMLIAVPLASILKIIYLELVEVLYERRGGQDEQNTPAH